MKVIRVEKKFCASCMEEHDVKIVQIQEENFFKGMELEYIAEYEYCEIVDELMASEEQFSKNDIAMKNAYREKMDLLTSDQIVAIRSKYGISQSDLAIVLGWGAKTITRYESHQVQDVAHDTILRKIETDPEWFLMLLQGATEKLTAESIDKYLSTATYLYEKAKDDYLRKSIYAQYAKYSDGIAGGGMRLNLDKVIDIVNYLAASTKVTALYLVKLVKMLWYIDALSYKRRGTSITGLVYCALPMGAVPVAYKRIIDLDGILYDEIDFDDRTGLNFRQNRNWTNTTLQEDELEIVCAIIERFGKATKKEIVDAMHREQAYIETACNDVIQYKYATNLSLD